MTLDVHRDEFIAELEQCRELRRYATEEIVNLEIKALTFESSFARAFRAYENFTEKSFLSYMTGETTASGITPDRYVSPSTVTHARAMIQGSAKFLDWADPNLVQQRSKHFLHEDGPLSTAMVQSMTFIHWARKIRNHISHNSLESQTQYRSAVTNILLIEPESLPAPGKLLQLRPQRGRYRGREIFAGLLQDLEAYGRSAAG